jgi:ParB/RepB/Spo0J family partition protein
MSALTLLAFQNASILRAFRTNSRNGGQVIHVLKELGEKLDRDPSNVRKSLKALADADLMAIDEDNPVVGRLTDAGEAALAALDRAEGGASGDAALPEGFTALRHDEIGPDPDNARKTSGLTPESIAEMADSLLDKGILQQPEVRINPAYPSSRAAQYLLAMGERRWRAWGKLIADGLWPADKRIVCKVEDRSEVERLEAGLVENLQRADISNLEMAEHFLILHRDHGRSPQDIAKKVGKTPRFVQIAIKVAAEALPDDKARYVRSETAYAYGKASNEPGVKRAFTWEELRNTVKTAKYITALEKRSRLTLMVAELALKVDADPDPYPASEHYGGQALTLIATPPGGGHWGEAQDLGVVIDHREGGQIFGGVTTMAREWLKDAGFENSPKGWTDKLASDVLDPMTIKLAKEAGVWTTAFFNVPKAKPLEPVAEPSPDYEPEEEPEAISPFTRPANPAEATDDTITPYQALLLGEVLHKTRHHGTAVPGDQDVSQLTPDVRFDVVLHRPLLWGGYLSHGTFSHNGRHFLRASHLAANYLNSRDLNPLRDIAKLHELRKAAGMKPTAGQIYAIPWLNEAAPAEANGVRATVDPEQDPVALYTALGGATPAPPTASPPTIDRDPAQLEPALFMILAEVAHKITMHGVEARGGAIRGAPVHNHHAGPDAKAAMELLTKRYLMFVQSPNALGFMASLTQAAWDYLGGGVDDERLEGFREDNLSTEDLLAFEASGQRYATTWLQDPVKIVEPRSAASPAAPEPGREPDASGDDAGSPFAEDGEDDDSDEAILSPDQVDAYVRQCAIYLLVYARPRDAVHSLASLGTIEDAEELAGVLKASGQYDQVDLYAGGVGGKLIAPWSAQ